MEHQTVTRVPRARSRSDHVRSRAAGSVFRVHPLMDLQRSMGNQAVQRLIRSPYVEAPPSLQRVPVNAGPNGGVAPTVHEAPRSSGQPIDTAALPFMEPRFGHDFGGGRIPLLQRQPDPEADKASVDACLKQTKDLLPGKVGVVEQINREAWLDEATGKERQNLEAQIRQEYDARKFVCEAGVPAMLALFYNRDYHNRLQVDRARESFTQHPDFYSSAGFDKLTKTKAFLQKKYRITIEPGDKAWNPEDIGLLAEALGKLTDSESGLIADYRFIRWTNKCNQLVAADPTYNCALEDYTTCGLHLAEVVHRDYTITMYDCYKSDPEETAKKGYNVQPGAETIVHEIGHAIEFARVRLALEKQGDAKREYQRLSKLADAAVGDAKASLNRQLAAAKKALDDADKALSGAMSPSVLDQFTALTKGKRALTPYSKENVTEAFAEAFMLFKVAPDQLKKANKPLFDWFAKGGFM